MIVVDTGPLVALLDADDRHHGHCRRRLAANEEPLFVPVPVVNETCYFIERDSGPEVEADFLGSVGLDGRFEMVDLQPNDWARVTGLLRTYADLPFGVVGASVMAVAERLKASQIATLDHRHFTVVRPSHNPAFGLLSL